MLSKLFDVLRGRNIDVYYIGQHIGACESPYVVLKDDGEQEVTGCSMNRNLIDVLIYCPQGIFDKVIPYVGEIKGILSEVKEIRDTRYRSPVIIDSDKKAYTTTLRYSNYKSIK